ncbi:LysM peptidoglycan-binding domain-containing protein [Staphylococcus sp. SQ8-PEA]|uniref:LysM peptidoglycan-binding domain-containing protein n=1 Tax=Staphylococcus marylandisciuri TaxID=2981529 RepID=A0ABT2QSM1_9STAP|nr:LysM peptidoglycan-binding domain-containing protein [Staphylococcus marylandisciuri]MCU5746986.1 LysM peptidoglycan-binding domain-containing protein [Staphylococcus marylandisciuri]
MRKKIVASVVGTSAIAAIASASAEAATYTVKSGDSLWSIASKYNLSVAKLKSLNNLNSNMIFPNQTLHVSSSQSTPTNSGNSNSSSTYTYTVKSGDTLYGIANRAGVSYSQIMRLNRFSNTIIYPGQKIVLRGNGATSSSNNKRSTSSNSSTVYTVQSGDSLSSIAYKYGTTYTQIMALNHLNNYFIYPGQSLRVSGSPSTTSHSSSQESSYRTPVFNHANLYDWGQCTWHAFNRRAQIGKGISTYWWNANNWDDAALRDGYVVDHRATVGSILQSDLGYYGHVAFVERINGDGSLLVSEMNYSAAPGITTYRTIPAYQVSSFKYIH